MALISFTCPLFPRYYSFTLWQFFITPCVSNVPDFLPVLTPLCSLDIPLAYWTSYVFVLPVLDSLQGFDPCLPRAPSLYIRYHLNSIIELPPLSRMSLHLGPIPRPPCSTASATVQTFQGALFYHVGLFSKLMSKLSTVSTLHTTPTNTIAIREGEHSSRTTMALIKGIRVSLFSRAMNREHIKQFALLIRGQSSPSHTDAIKKKKVQLHSVMVRLSLRMACFTLLASAIPNRKMTLLCVHIFCYR